MEYMTPHFEITIFFFEIKYNKQSAQGAIALFFDVEINNNGQAIIVIED